MLSYFLFLKSLLLLNVIIFVLVFSFLTVPQILKEGNTLKESNETVLTTSPNVSSPSNGSSFSPLTGGTCSVQSYNSSGKSVQDHIVDFITGQVGLKACLRFNFRVKFINVN